MVMVRGGGGGGGERECRSREEAVSCLPSPGAHKVRELAFDWQRQLGSGYLGCSVAYSIYIHSIDRGMLLYTLYRYSILL